MTEVVLSAEAHFESLRAPVWARFRARHAALPRECFEDAYSEWWARELERAAAGRPSRAAHPVAFVCEGVRRVVIDDGRSRARGIARGEKATLQIAALEEAVETGGSQDTAAQARYEALAHRILELVRDRLTPRELQVFVSTHLYLQSTEDTARLLGLSVPRVKKDRVRAAGKLGEEVWALLAAELELCASAPAGRLSGVYETLVEHVEDCDGCARSLGGLRRGALVVVGPFELLAIAPRGEATAWLDGLLVRFGELVDRWTVAASTMPAGGRGAVAVAAAVAIAGGGTAAGVHAAGDDPAGPAGGPPASASVAAPSPSSAPPAASGGSSGPSSPDVSRAAVRERAGATRERSGERRKRRKAKRAESDRAAQPAASATPAPTATPSTGASVQAPVASGGSAEPPSPAPPAPAAPAQPSGAPGEFGFERG